MSKWFTVAVCGNDAWVEQVHIGRDFECVFRIFESMSSPCTDVDLWAPESRFVSSIGCCNGMTLWSLCKESGVTSRLLETATQPETPARNLAHQTCTSAGSAPVWTDEELKLRAC